MASISASCLRFQHLFHHSNNTCQIANRTSLKLVSVSWANGIFSSLKATRFCVSCAAKPEPVEKVCDIVREQLALKPDKEVTPASTFSDLGADSLDTMEIVMGLEEEFDISVKENSDNVSTIQEAADMIESLLEKKAKAGTGS